MPKCKSEVNIPLVAKKGREMQKYCKFTLDTSIFQMKNEKEND